ncbi:hypothetical protein BDZ94DRAFT_1308453 [Collybia nuda]|uniref:Uncharacterized protein n=1 Tax=Collybia nuda TaxID=64659 RepID=A0A9P6CKD1_9AGAR|nr:hypothetical protein BDZ94DRAFT_1308453 [Collybia nuda]
MSRYIQHSNQPPTNLDAVAEDIKTALMVAVSQCYSQTQHFSGTVYTGLAGRVLMKYYLSSLPLPHEELNARTSLWSVQDLRAGGDRDIVLILESTPERTWKVHDASRIAFLETNVGVAALGLCRALEGSEDLLKHWERCAQLLQQALEHVYAEARSLGGGEDGCEILYGRAGFLYALLLVRKTVIRVRGGSDPALPPPLVQSAEGLVADDSIRAVVSDIVRCGEIGARRYATRLASAGSADNTAGPPLMWSWFDTRYLGAAHGVAGILQVLWSCPAAVIAPYLPRMLETVQWLLGRQDSTGNWPAEVSISLNQVQENELIQWCHGAPGMVILLSNILQWSRAHTQHAHVLDPALHETLATSLRAGTQLVYQHGLLRKGLGLCHGVAGSVYTLLAASDALDLDVDSGQDVGTQWQYLRWAIHLAHLATNHTLLVARGEMGVPDHPLSLYEGLAGMCCAWALVLCRISRLQLRSGDGDAVAGKRAVVMGSGHGMPGYDGLGWEGGVYRLN